VAGRGGTMVTLCARGGGECGARIEKLGSPHHPTRENHRRKGSKKEKTQFGLG